MATYNFPSITPTTQTFELVTNTKQFQSPLSNAIQTVSRNGSYWKTTMVFNNLTGFDRATLQAFIAKLDGQTHRMLLRDYGHVRRGEGSAVVNISTQTNLVQGMTGIILDGAPADVDNFFRTGDYISFNNELHMVTANADTTSTGSMSVDIAPPVRKPTNQDSPVTFSNATGVFMMTNNPQWRTQAPYFSSITIEAIEDVLA